MIKLATTDDTLIIVKLLKQFLTETSYSQATEASQNFEHLCKITWMTLQHGYIWLAYVDEKPAGLLMAIKEPNLWLPQARE